MKRENYRKRIWNIIILSTRSPLMAPASTYPFPFFLPTNALPLPVVFYILPPYPSPTPSFPLVLAHVTTWGIVLHEPSSNQRQSLEVTCSMNDNKSRLRKTRLRFINPSSRRESGYDKVKVLIKLLLENADIFPIVGVEDHSFAQFTIFLSGSHLERRGKH